MPLKSIMFGSIGTLVETSDIQRQAYNEAMKETGLPWYWDRDTYSELLLQSGGKDRLAHLAAATSTVLPQTKIDQIHTRKTEIACAQMVSQGISPRPGVVELLAFAKKRGIKLAFVTTTYQANIDAVFGAVGNAFHPNDFDFIASRATVARGKPFPDVYLEVLVALGVDASEALAIEDTALSAMSAKRAGIDVVVTPGELTAGQDLWQADLVIDALGDGLRLNEDLLGMLAGK
jgi:beta-phosphoglucomutase-like phosphatase (HAD superfamily)